MEQSTNYSTSTRIKIGGQSNKQNNLLKGHVITTETSDDVSCPKISGTNPSAVFYQYKNKYADFAFTKLSGPLYGDNESIARITGIPMNHPDYIADFHFIGLMRSLDDMNKHKYQGKIQVDPDNVNPN